MPPLIFARIVGSTWAFLTTPRSGTGVCVCGSFLLTSHSAVAITLATCEVSPVVGMGTETWDLEPVTKVEVVLDDWFMFIRVLQYSKESFSFLELYGAKLNKELSDFSALCPSPPKIFSLLWALTSGYSHIFKS